MPTPPSPAVAELSDILARHRAVLTHPPTLVPTNHMPDGPLLGNGDMTAVLGGPADLQTFHLGKSDFWTDGEGWAFTNEDYDGYVISPITVGGVRLWVRDFACATYRQEIDLERAAVHGTFTSQGTTLHSEAWLSATDNLLVWKLSVTGASALGLRVQTFAKTSDDPRSDLPTQAGHDADLAWATRETWDRGRWVARACLATRILGVKARCWSDARATASSFFLLPPGQSAIVVTALAGGKDATTHRSQATGMIAGLTLRDVPELERRHRQWWSDYWRKAYVDLGGDILERFWYGAQYVLACCSRPGHTAPGIFGFATDDHPRWSGDYHLNYNFEQPFQAACASNRPELVLPYVDAINDFLPEGQRRAAVDLDPPMPGVYYPIGLGPWGYAAQDDYMGQKCAAAFATIPFIDYFHHTLDPAFTRAKLYPFVREVGRFWQNYLRLEDDRYVIRGSASHEHGGHHVNTTFDLPLVRRVFQALLDMSRLLDVDAAERPAWRDILAHLPPYPTTSHQGKTVLKESEDAPTHTRSISLFNAIWPGGGVIGLGGDPAWRRIACDTLTALNLWEQGNSFAWVFPAAARLAYPGLYDLLHQRLSAPDGLRANLVYAQAYGGIETCGGAATINEMLLQSYDGILRLFPAWPVERDASFVHLRTYGAFLVSAEQQAGHVQPLTIFSEVGSNLQLLSPWADQPIVVKTGAQTLVTNLAPHREGYLLTMPTTAGGSYVIAPAK